MARHSHFANIKRAKDATDAVRGKVFTMHARMIAIAARAGGDPTMNIALATAIERAKAANVPNSNIERAIKKGTGEDKEGVVFEEATYEAIGPGGSAFLIDVITDNKNRSLTNVRTLLSKNGGNLGSSGSVSWKFEKKGYLVVDAGEKKGDEVELSLIECGAEDLTENDAGHYEVYCAPGDLGAVRDAVKEVDFKVVKDELAWRSKNLQVITDLDVAKKILQLTEVLDEDDDVARVTTDTDFSDELVVQLG